MDMDNAKTAQIEILRDVFNFAELPGAGEGAAAFVDPDYGDSTALEVDLPDILASAVEAPAGMVTRRSDKAKKARASKPASKASDHVALGVRKAGEAFRLVALYQRPGLDKDPLIGQIKDKLGEEVDIVYGGRVRALQGWHYARTDPLKVGASCGHFRITAGTLGAFAQCRDTGAMGILSNNHVLADVNAGQPGDAIWQPGKSDGGVTASAIGTLEKFVPFKFSGASNGLDCAWAKLDDSRGTDKDQITDSAEIPVGQIVQAAPDQLMLGDLVVKMGRTTGYTQGEVTLINVSNLVVGMPGGLDVRFDNQIQIESLSKKPFSAGGDSGSLILRNDGVPCGLLFAGSGAGGAFNQGVTYVNDLATVLDALSIDLVI